MGLIKRQLLKVIEWTDTTPDTMVYKFPVNDRFAVMNGSQLIVRESQVCLFLSGGKLADVFQPGRYKLDTGNMPVLTALMSWKYAFESPFTADIYYINTKQYIGQKWGTTNPIMMRDKDFGMVRFRSYGTYSFKVSDPPKFLREVAGTKPDYKINLLTDQLKSIIVEGVSQAVSASDIAALDLAAKISDLRASTEKLALDRFTNMGIELAALTIENISLPDEVEKALDKRTSMGALGDVNRYTAFQAADSMRDIAQNSYKGNGMNMPGLGMGLGTGFIATNMFAGGIQQGVQQGRADAAQAQQQQAAAPAAPAASTVKCPGCGAAIPAGNKFCPECGFKLITKCPACGADVKAGTKFCPECGANLAAPPAPPVAPAAPEKPPKCPECGKEVKPGAKFCPYCGAKL